MIDVRQLSYFIAVVEAKSFTAASEVLCVAQPALSQHLQRLEQEVGQQLLVRHSRGVEPTEAGLRLLEHARSILTMVEHTKNDLRNFDEHPRRRVRIGMPRSLCDSLAVRLMSLWPHNHPHVSLQIVESSSSTLTASVLAGELDLAVTSYPSDSTMLIAEPLVQDKICALMPGEGESGEVGEVRFADLVRQPLILNTPKNVSRQLIELTAKYCSVELNVAYEIDSTDLAFRMVEGALGSTILPYLAVKKYLNVPHVDVRVIVGPSITRRLHIIRPRHRPLSKSESRVCTAIKERLRRQFARDAPLVDMDFLSERSQSTG